MKNQKAAVSSGFKDAYAAAFPEKSEDDILKWWNTADKRIKRGLACLEVARICCNSDNMEDILAWTVADQLRPNPFPFGQLGTHFPSQSAARVFVLAPLCEKLNQVLQQVAPRMVEIDDASGGDPAVPGKRIV